MPLPSDTSLDDVKLRIRETYRNPNVGQIYQVVLRDGPRTLRIATLIEILDGKTRQFHHFSLKLDSIDRRKAGWFAKPERSVRLEGEAPDEIEHLYRFLKSLLEGNLANKTGELRIINSGDYANLAAVLDVLPKLATADKLGLIKAALSRIDGPMTHVREFIEAFEGADIRTLGHIATAARIVQYKAAHDQLRRLVEESESDEHVLQKHLEAHPWMFGSEYSELLDRRTWTRDDRLDFMLRRTVDGFLEIVEIKTPFAEHLLQLDRARDSYYPSSRLSMVIGQCMRYIEEVERGRDAIVSKDGHDPLKIRARIIMGRDHDAAHQAALRNLNSHLHRLEVITFDQLLRIGARVLSVFEGKSPAVVDDSDDIPF
jgi:hypothetical protein